MLPMFTICTLCTFPTSVCDKPLCLPPALLSMFVHNVHSVSPALPPRCAGHQRDVREPLPKRFVNLKLRKGGSKGGREGRRH